MSEPTFKPCMQHQPLLFPPDISDLIPENAMVRVVDALVDDLGTQKLRGLYPGGGAPAYDPSMMLKVVLFAYASKIYSSRGIAKATRENINFMWLCGLHPLDHNTVNRFRSERIAPVFEEVFTGIVLLLAEQGYISLDTYFLDGTKIEANANKFSFVWKKSTDRYQGALRDRVHALLSAIDEMEDEEEALAPEEPGEIDAERIAEAARRINERLAEREKDKQGQNQDLEKELRQAAKKLQGDYLARMQKYEAQQEIFAGRNSFSKTDRDATFMRLKDDYMGNGQLKAAYNIQVGTENQFVIASSVHERPGDTACTVAHCEHVKELFGRLPRNVVADAGYGSEENYAYFDREGVEAYVKHSEFFRECRNRKWREDEMRVANWAYLEDEDAYVCPEGRLLPFLRESKTTSDLGFESTTRIYGCSDCSDCTKRGRCMKSKNPDARRTVQINPRLSFFKERASGMLHTEIGSELRKRRGTDVETVFGDIKRNALFTRFSLRGKTKVTLEWLLVAAGHNIRKMAAANARRAEA